MNFKTCYALLFALSLAASLTAQAGTVWSVQKITDNDFNDVEPVLSNTDVAWLSWPSDASSYEVYVYDGAGNTRLTDNSLNEQNLFASDKYIAWNSRDYTNGDDIFLYDGMTVAQITDSTIGEYRPRVNGEQMVWSSWDYDGGGTSGDVIVYDIASSTPTLLVPPKNFDQFTNDSNPWIYGDSVALIATWGFSTLYIYDIPTGVFDNVASATNQPQMNDDYLAFDYSGTVRVYDRAADTINSLGESSSVQLSGQYLTWVSDSSSTAHNDSLYLYDASNADNEPQVIASNAEFSSYSAPSIDGNLLSYSGWDGNDLEIYVYEIDSGITTQLSDNDYSDKEPKLRGNRVAWVYFDGPGEDTGDDEIMLATGTDTVASGDCTFFVIPAGNSKTAVICL